MKVVGYLSYYDESPHWLATAVAGMARVCDVIIGHDGAYALYPGARARSHPQQAEAIMLAAEAAGAGCLVYRPQDVYRGNEVEKRQQGLKFAAGVLEEGDWLLIFDADFHVLQVKPEIVRAKLEDTKLDVATYTILDGKDLLADEALARFAREKWADTEWTLRTRDIYRWHPTLEIGPTHWSYSHRREGTRTWLRGPWDSKNVEALNLDADLVVYHRTQDRAQVRKHAADVYYQRRTEMNLEYAPEVAPE